MGDPEIEDSEERTRRLIDGGIITPPNVIRPEGYRLPLPTGRMISQEAMDRIWSEERDGR